MIYGGLHVASHQEILTTEHEHYSTHNCLAFRLRQHGTQVRKLRLFDKPGDVSTDRVLSVIDRSIRPETRVLGMTWVHSGSGVKLPVGAIGELYLTPTFATFSRNEDFGTIMTPGGYHAFEHRWALGEAFKLHLELGKADVQARIHQLNDYLKARLAEHRAVELVTPVSREFSAGFTFFRIKDRDPDAVAAYLNANKVMVDAVDRDAGPVIRFAPSLLNDEQQVDRAMALLRTQIG
ncbi:hypothetical protein WR25_13207 [Diploscapter pachys]|uniref:Uncharacterized protein n=1 Tax=Diploscapter pachys TaxID=2018661 RepID=A0A2A2K3P6_9BILA|nr:hypothetical protein WR25_13207 [Diploscapter pachys]